MRQIFLKNRCKRWYIGCSLLVWWSDQPENVQICRSTVQKRDFFAFFDYFFKSRKKFNKRVKFLSANQIFQKENHAGQKKTTDKKKNKNKKKQKQQQQKKKKHKKQQQEKTKKQTSKKQTSNKQKAKQQEQEQATSKKQQRKRKSTWVVVFKNGVVE